MQEGTEKLKMPMAKPAPTELRGEMENINVKSDGTGKITVTLTLVTHVEPDVSCDPYMLLVVSYTGKRVVLQLRPDT